MERRFGTGVVVWVEIGKLAREMRWRKAVRAWVEGSDGESSCSASTHVRYLSRGKGMG